MKKLTRRQIIASSGFSLSLPWLEYFSGVKPALAATPGFTPEGRPKRLISVIGGLGSLRSEYVDNSGNYKRIMKPLEENKDRVTVIKGYEIVHKEGGHASGNFSIMSGWDTHKVGNGRISAQGPSIDQRCLNFLKPNTLVPMVLGAYNSTKWSPSTRERGKSNRLILSPYTVFDSLFQGQPTAPPGNGNNAAAQQTQARLEMLNRTHAAYKDLEKRIGADDKHRVGAHIQGLDEIIRRLKVIQQQEQDMMAGIPACTAPQLGAHSLLPPRSSTIVEREPDNLNQVRSNIAKDDAVIFTWMDIFAHAMACDLSRIFTFFAGDFHNHNNHSHKARYNNRNANKDAYDGVVDGAAALGGRVNYLINKMKSLDDGFGSVMDNSLIYWAYTLSDGAGHKFHDSRLVLAGNAGGAFQTGRVLGVDASKNLPHTQVLTSVVNAMGVPDEHHGDPSWNRGAMPELGVSR